MGNVKIIDHPLIQHKLTLIRNKSTGSKEFRELVEELSLLMGYEVTRDLPLEEVETKLSVLLRPRLSVKKAIVPILRAGLVWWTEC